LANEDLNQTATDFPPVNTGSKPAKKQESWFEVVKTIFYALLIAGVIRSFIFQPFNIPSGSMEDTLLVGDYLFVSKAAYGYSRYSFPFGAIPFSGRFMASAPKARRCGGVQVPRRQFDGLHQAAGWASWRSESR
jgi:hypothetical protein